MRSLPARELPAVQRGPAQQVQECRGESGWCSDMTSTHGMWRHTGVRFLLSGAAAACAAQHGAASAAAMPWRRPLPVTGLAHCACGDTQGFDSSSPALRLPVLPSMLPRRQPPCHGVGPCGHRAGLVWCGHTQRLESASPQLPPCCAGPLPNGVSRNFGVLKGSARLCGRCLRGNCPLSSAARRSKFKNAGVSRAGART